MYGTDSYAPTANGRGNIEEKIKLYNQAKQIRQPMEADYRMAAAYCLPRQHNAWLTEGEGQIDNASTRRFAYDNTGIRSVPKYVAILNAIHTPEGQRWHKLEAADPNLQKLHEVREYHDALTAQLFKYRYDYNAMFKQAQGEMYTSIGVYGTAPKSLTWGRGMNGIPSFKYKSWPLRDIFLLVSDDGEVTHVFRRFFINARQFKLKWPNAKPPRTVAAELEKPQGSDEAKKFEFVQCLYYRTNHDPDNMLSIRRHRVACDYICIQDKEYAGDEEAYSSMPILAPRVYTEAGNPYGYSPAIQGLPALGGVSAMKKTVIKQGHKALDPAYITNDDGNLSNRLDIRPGRVNAGGVNAAGQKLVHALETGNFRVAEKLIEDERRDIEDPFFVLLFSILAERPEMTAAQVYEEIGQKASLLAPTMGRLQSEDSGPQIQREIELLTENGLRPDMPPVLIEAGAQYNVKYTSPMAKAMNAEDVTGFMRWVEFNLNYAQAAQDPECLDRIDMDTANPEVADYMNVKTRWVRSDTAVEEKRAKRQKATRQQQIIEQAPAIASVANTAMKQDGSQTPGVSNG
jgi:hypothetical protein